MNEAESKQESRGRLSATDWEQAALTVLAESGVAAVAVESLARTLGVTKGSFYWHFPTREALLKAAIGVAAVAVESLARTLGVTKGSFYWHFPTREALLKAAIDRWEQRDEDQVISYVERIEDPRARLRELFHRVSREVQSHLVYAALLQASDNALVQPVLERISRRRLTLLTETYAEAGFEPTAAKHRARLAYTAYSGFLQLNQRHGMPRMDQEEYAAYVDHVIATLVPA